MRIAGIEGHGYHGLFDVERENRQPFIVDVELELDLSKAGKSDDLNDSIDYNDVAILIHNEIVGPPVKLIETLALRPIQRCKKLKLRYTNPVRQSQFCLAT
jgi:dihydroneopterin aldolase